MLHIIQDMKNRSIHYFDYYALLFFCVSFFGWLWEAFLYLFIDGSLVNRGVYYGPYLPVYGIGGLILIILLHARRRQPFQVFILSSVICTALEYAAAVWLEDRWGVRWWDYSNFFMNIDGKVCLVCSIGFGLGGVMLICFFQPVFNRLYHKMTLGMRIFICIVLVIIFAADAAYSIMNPNTGPNITCIFMPNHLP